MLFFFILGGGIYALGEVGGEVGGAIWAAFLLALVLAALTAGSYAELVTKFPRAGGGALYAKKAFRSPLAEVGAPIVASYRAPSTSWRTASSSQLPRWMAPISTTTRTRPTPTTCTISAYRAPLAARSSRK